MTDLEQRIRDLLQERAPRGDIDPGLAPPVARRARRRQIGTGIVTVMTVAAMVLTVLGVIAYLRPGKDRAPIPSSAGPLRSVTLSGVTITYPEGWYLLQFPDEVATLQLTNFDPAFTEPCFTGGAVELPRDGALLLVDVGPTMDPGPSLPVPLVYDPSPSACRPGGLEETLAPGEPEHRSAHWANGEANAMFGTDVSDADRDAILDAFASFDDSGTGDPHERIDMGARLVLDSLETPVGRAIVTIDLGTRRYADDPPGLPATLSVIGPPGAPGPMGIVLDGRPPEGDTGTTMFADTWGAVVWGTVTTDVASAELRAAGGDLIPATLHPLPPALGLDQQAVWGIVLGPVGDRVSIVLYDADGNDLNDGSAPPVVEERTTIATGTHPEDGPWEYTLERTEEGIGLAFGFTNGGGGSGCCLSPLGGEDLVLDGYGTGGEASNITAIGSDALAAVSFVSMDGTRFDGAVYDMPPNDEGIPKAALVLVPRDVPIEGTLIGFDASGAEIGRSEIGDLGEPPGSTPEVDAVWTMLREARDGVLRWANEHGDSLERLSAGEMGAFVPDVTWNASGAGKPVPNEVSVRGVTEAGGDEATGWSGWTTVLVSATRSADGGIGETFCIAVNVDDGGGGNFRYGLQDAASYVECRGGWGI